MRAGADARRRKLAQTLERRRLKAQTLGAAQKAQALTRSLAVMSIVA